MHRVLGAVQNEIIKLYGLATVLTGHPIEQRRGTGIYARGTENENRPLSKIFGGPQSKGANRKFKRDTEARPMETDIAATLDPNVVWACMARVDLEGAGPSAARGWVSAFGGSAGIASRALRRAPEYSAHLNRRKRSRA